MSRKMFKKIKGYQEGGELPEIDLPKIPRPSSERPQILITPGPVKTDPRAPEEAFSSQPKYNFSELDDLIPSKDFSPAAPVKYEQSGPFAELDALIPKPDKPSFLGTSVEALRKGFVEGLEEAEAGLDTPFKETTQEPDTSHVGQLLQQQISEGWTDPQWWSANILHGAARGWPSLTTGALGALAGSQVAPGAGTLIGGMGGFALGSAIQSLAPAYQRARKRGLEHDAAVNEAYVQSGIAAVFGAAMAGATALKVIPGEAAAKRAISEALAQIFAVQPSLQVGQQLTFSTVIGEMPSVEDIAKTYVIGAGVGVPIVAGHYIAPKIASSAKKAIEPIVSDFQMKIAPMSMGSPQARAAAKDTMNNVRLARYEWNQIDAHLAKKFTPEQLKNMWEAADEESVARQSGAPTVGIGLSRLNHSDRAVVEALQDSAQRTFETARNLGMVEGEGLPSYVPRMMVKMTEDGQYGSSVSGNVPGGARGLDSIGTNVRTSTPQLRHRKYLTAEETETAARSKLGEDVEVARNIRALPLVTARLQEAIAWRSLINQIKEIGKTVGDETVSEGRPGERHENWFHIDHPSFKTWRPKFQNNEEGKIVPILNNRGEPVFEQIPLYMRKEFEGPMRSILTKKSGALYDFLMSLKGRTMSVIMYSPLIHNMVEWGRALPATPGKVATGKIYFEGNKAKHNIGTMQEAIQAGLDPIGRRYFNQDISSIMEEPTLTPGRSWTSQILAHTVGYLPQKGMTTKQVQRQVMESIDKAGDFWHNTLLWDRVGDLQVGLYTNIRDDMMGKGFDRGSSSRFAAHFANRYAGALPREAMSDNARKIANMALFSRSFTLGERYV